jgi:predicted ATP-grasp superfamily ATP-dependent carboligase
MVEFRRSSKHGRFFLLEINPRFWGSLPLAVACGFNFPYLLCLLALGLPLKTPSACPRKKLTFVPLKVRSVLKDTQLGWRRKLIGLAECILETLNPKVVKGILSLSDPLPMLAFVS